MSYPKLRFPGGRALLFDTLLISGRLGKATANTQRLRLIERSGMNVKGCRAQQLPEGIKVDLIFPARPG